MVKYWDNQHVIDVVISIILALLAVQGPKAGIPVIMTITAESLILSTRAWVGPALTLLGMMSATTAFIFSVVDRSEFSPLKDLGVESQLWKVFSENIFWLTFAAVCAMIISFLQPGYVPDVLLTFVMFLFFIVSICLLKFSWVMRQIISVRASR